MTHHLWNSLLSVPQPLLGTMPEPFLKSCMTYQLLRQTSKAHITQRGDKISGLLMNEQTNASQNSLHTLGWREQVQLPGCPRGACMIPGRPLVPF